MVYKTTKAIRDSQDNDYCYYAGAIYPRKGLEVSDERLEELVRKGAIVKLEEETIALIQEEATPEELEEPTVPLVQEEAEEPTVKEIKQALEERGIDYKARANKAELLELLEQTGDDNG
ncbi:hypothetical protein [Streptococcus sp. zg-JUN1979]|uniref:hypothetical protein n=1 Tax=Streptococcus sp. zg-JUN1979 TaxID=3391450 RepID=UPI0039A71EF3